MVVGHAHDERKLLLFERYRAHLLELFKLPEALYLDVDIDVVGSLMELPSLIPAMPTALLWTRDAVPMEHCIRALYYIDGSHATRLLQAGFLYMKGNLHDPFEQALTQFKSRMSLDSVPLPGTVCWNMVMNKLTETGAAVELPEHWHRTMWDPATCVRNAITVHWSGRWKVLQPYVTYMRGGGRPHMIIDATPVAYRDYEIRPYEYAYQFNGPTISDHHESMADGRSGDAV
jgi:hypothetical protein